MNLDTIQSKFKYTNDGQSVIFESRAANDISKNKLQRSTNDRQVRNHT